MILAGIATADEKLAAQQMIEKSRPPNKALEQKAIEQKA
jgi:hypothetical protein